MNTFAYIRVSGKGQVDGDGYDRQAEKINAFCNLHNLDSYGVHYEAAVSGTVEAMSRPAFLKMLEQIDASNKTEHPIQAIVVERMDRLARDLMVSEFLLRECRERGIKVFSADQGQLLDMASNDVDPTRILIRQLMAALAQWEKSMLVMKLRIARDHKRETGARVEGVKPYGTMPGEASILELAYNLYQSGSGPSRVADYLNQGGFKTRGGKPWDRKTAYHILKIAESKQHNERLLGTDPEAGAPELAQSRTTEPLEDIIASLKYLAGLPRL